MGQESEKQRELEEERRESQRLQRDMEELRRRERVQKCSESIHGCPRRPTNQILSVEEKTSSPIDEKTSKIVESTMQDKKFEMETSITTSDLIPKPKENGSRLNACCWELELLKQDVLGRI